MLNDLYWNLDPVLFSAGPFTVRWYGIAYVAGFVCAALLIWRLAKRWRIRVDADALLTIMFCVIIGVVAGGRLGYVLFYGNGLEFYLQNPLEVQPWRHELPRRARGSAPRRHSGREDDGHPVPHVGRPGLRGGSHRALLRPPGELRERRAVGRPHRPAVGRRVRRGRGLHAAPPLPALRGAAGGRAHLRRAVPALAQAPVRAARSWACSLLCTVVVGSPSNSCASPMCS